MFSEWWRQVMVRMVSERMVSEIGVRIVEAGYGENSGGRLSERTGMFESLVVTSVWVI